MEKNYTLNFFPPIVRGTEQINNSFFEDNIATMSRFKDGYFDLAVCDVNYGISVCKMPFVSQKTNLVKQKNGSIIKIEKNYRPMEVDNWDEKTPEQTYFDELCRVSKHQIIFGVDYVNWNGLGKGRIKWNKGVAEGMSFSKFENAYCSLIDYTINIDLLWSGMQQAKSITEPMIPQGNKKLNEKRIHECHKPIFLYDIIFSIFGFKGMKIIDTHLGSGSSRISAHKFNFEFVGAENNRKNYDNHAQRWREYNAIPLIPFV